MPLATRLRSTAAPGDPPEARRITRRHRTAITLCVVLAAAVNAAALGLASRGSAHRVAIPPGSHVTTGRSGVMLLAAPTTRVARPPLPAAAPTLATPATVAPIKVVRPERIEPTQDHDAEPEVAPAPTRFYAFDEVDRPAWPVTDWPLDVDTLDEFGLERLVFEVMVNDRGQILACTVLHPVALNEAMRTGLEQRLASTAMQPAERDGRPVASVRRIEMVVEPSPETLEAPHAAMP